MGRYVHDRFRQRPTAQLVGGAEAGGTNGNVNQMLSGNAYNVPYEYLIIGTQTVKVPTVTATGLSFGLDLADDEGIQFIFGASAAGTARGRLAYTIGTDPAFFMKGTITGADVSTVDALYFGFRKQVAINADPTAYTDYACFALLTAANPAVIQTTTRLNTGTAASVDTTQTWADAASKTFEIRVDGGGVTKFLLNDATPTISQAFTFDSGDLVVPWLHLLHEGTVGAGDTWIISELEIGFLPE
jgi:hypothetical protein